MQKYIKIWTKDRIPQKEGFYITDWNSSTQFGNNHFLSISGGIVDSKVEWWLEEQIENCLETNNMVITIRSRQHITGRGTVFVMCLRENGFTNEHFIKEIPISVGTNIIVDDELYMVVGVEAQSIFESKYKTLIGLIVIPKQYDRSR